MTELDRKNREAMDANAATIGFGFGIAWLQDAARFVVLTELQHQVGPLEVGRAESAAEAIRIARREFRRVRLGVDF